VDIDLPPNLPAADAGVERHLRVRWLQRRATAWAPGGHLVAWDQVGWPVTARRSRRAVAAPDGLDIEVDEAGGLRSLRWHGVPLLAGPVTFTARRAPIDNDGLKVMPLQRWMPLHRWRAADWSLLDVRQRVEVDRAGVLIHTRALVPPELADPPRLGHVFTMPARFDRLRWFGEGPHECYPDRRSAATVGIWEQPPDELPYLMPQEFGLRTGVRWWELRDGADAGLRIEAHRGGLLACAATHHTDADLEAARDRLELARTEDIVVHVDHRHRGLGTASCGPDTAPEYRIAAGLYEWAFRLVPLG